MKIVEKVKNNGGIERYLIKKIYFGEDQKRLLELCDEREKANQNKTSLINVMKEKINEIKMQKEADEREDELSFIVQILQEQDGVEREIYDINGISEIVKIGTVENVVDDELNPYAKRLKMKDFLRKDYRTHPLFVKFFNNYIKIDSAKRLSDTEVLLNASVFNDNEKNEYIVVRI